MTKEYSFADKSEWAEALEEVNGARKATPWMMARLILWGIQNLCANRDEVADLYDEVSEQLEVQRKTLQNYASVARRFPPDEVRERLEIGHHITVVAMPSEEADEWLDRAEFNAWSVAKLRLEIRKAAQEPSEEQYDEDDEEGRGEVARLLTTYGINVQTNANRMTLGFPDGRWVTVTSITPLKWQVT